MVELTANERRHLAAIQAIQQCSRLDSTCGDCDTLDAPLQDYLPLHQFNEDWDEVRIDGRTVESALRFRNLGARWSMDDGTAEIGGEYRVLHFYDVFDQPSGPEPPTPDATDFQKEFLSELRLFDYTALSGAGMSSFLRMTPNTEPLEIWFRDVADVGADPYPPGYLKLDLTYSAYLDALLVTKGTYGWQYLYADPWLGAEGLHSHSMHLEGMLNVFPEVFPEHDYGPLRERLEARWL